MNNLAHALQEDTDTLENGQDATPNGQDGAKRSLRSAINQNCKDCIYDGSLKGGLGTWRQQVEACTVFKCALYSVRPISKPKKEKELPAEE